MKKYDEPSFCNKCEGKNKLTATYNVDGTVCEYDSICLDCGHGDYWAYGFFESQIDGFNKSKKY